MHHKIMLKDAIVGSRYSTNRHGISVVLQDLPAWIDLYGAWQQQRGALQFPSEAAETSLSLELPWRRSWWSSIREMGCQIQGLHDGSRLIYRTLQYVKRLEISSWSDETAIE